jgi:hypothetical protein
MIDELEGKLTPPEKRVREKALRQIRRYVGNMPRPGLGAGTKKSFPTPPQGEIRVDIEVQAGMACVPDESGE